MGHRLEDHVERDQQETSERAERARSRRSMPGGLHLYDDDDDADDPDYAP